MPDESKPATPDGAKKPSPLRLLMDAKVRPALEKAGAFYTALNMREKTMLVVFAAVFILVVDYWLFLRPVMRVFTETMPQLSTLDAELDGLRTDKKNRPLLAKSWEDTKARVAEREETFITRDRVPALLENISKLALDSSVKILSLRPISVPADKSARAPKGYALVPIRLNAIAGTHELGSFLARVESGPTFFRVKDVRIVGQGEQDTRRHMIEVNLETYTRTELRSVKK